ncbi:MAG: hypothetical protein WC975_02000 [Phycisphaerae bacterium]
MVVTLNDEISKTGALPADDGTMAKALADLDAKLEAWSGAITHAQTSLKSLITQQNTQQTKPAVSRERVIAQTRNPSAASPPNPPKIAEPVKEKALPSPNEDEALLASLDPETARKIQVLRRLSGNTKSVRELLEKHSVTASTPPATPSNKKNFWRR